MNYRKEIRHFIIVNIPYDLLSLLIRTKTLNAYIDRLTYKSKDEILKLFMFYKLTEMIII